MANGETLVAVISRNLPEALVVNDASGQQRTIPRAQIASMQTLPTSLMPSGLDRSMTEEELVDLVGLPEKPKMRTAIKERNHHEPF